MNRTGNSKKNPYDPGTFEKGVKERIKQFSKDESFKALAKKWFSVSFAKGYAHNFSWFGLPVIQAPQDIMAMQELIFRIKPDLIIETGVARGGSLVFYASLLFLLGGKRNVVGIDININKENKVNTDRVWKHPLGKLITMIEGSSVDPLVFKKVKKIANRYKKVLVCLDSSHTHSHVLSELEIYSKLVSLGSYLVVFDTFVEQVPRNIIGAKPWGKGNNPATAVKLFLSKNKNFVVDKDIEGKIIATSNPGGFLRRVK